ncbi:MAG: hypothetical protein PVJ38_04220 [Candidatus Bathyarchaeota archaeon]
MQEEFVTCNNCGKEVPNTQFCIYCGHNMVRMQDRPRQVWDGTGEPETPRPPETARREESVEEFSIPAYESPPEQRHLIAALTTENDPEIIHLTKEILKYHIYTVKLCEILSEKGMPLKAFTNILEDYRGKIRELRASREDKRKEYKEQYEEKKAELEDAEVKIDEMRVRVAIGEIAESDLILKTPGIRENVKSLKKDISLLEKKLKPPNAEQLGLSPRDIYRHEGKTQELIGSIKDLVVSGIINEELGDRLNSHLRETLRRFSTLVNDQEEIEIRKELEVLEARFKVGEISETELVEMKRDIETKLEALWDKNL